MIKRLYEKAFLSARFFTIAIKKKTEESIIDTKEFAAEYVFPATLNKWSADPMLVEYEDKTYLFYESAIDNKGRIEAVEVFADCTVSAPVVVFDEEFHMSYPFVFKKNNRWYMIPETSAVDEVRLYSSESFPNKWILKEILLKGKYVDTTVCELGQETVLLTYRLSENSERVTPEAYRVDIDWKLTKLEWNQYDELRVRGAGAAFSENKAMCRPAQISTDVLYGNGLVFYSMEYRDGIYSEKEVCEINSDGVRTGKIWHDGLHTYTRSGKFEAIDIRCREFDAGKIFHRLFR